ncbi:MAG: hypothetical protein QOI57_2777, partial [Rubrobacteraceae bacterium]|nr:hypothetical protein [Rubrobacteraceae bacterium]
MGRGDGLFAVRCRGVGETIQRTPAQEVMGLKESINEPPRATYGHANPPPKPHLATS